MCDVVNEKAKKKICDEGHIRTGSENRMGDSLRPENNCRLRECMEVGDGEGERERQRAEPERKRS